MTNKGSAQTQPLPGNLQRSFENAVRDIYQASFGGKLSSYRRPIAERTAVPTVTGLKAEKKALSDAAKALSQLWKVSPSSSR